MIKYYCRKCGDLETHEVRQYSSGDKCGKCGGRAYTRRVKQ